MKGQILIEVIVALGIAIVIITGVTAAGITALNNEQFAKNQTLAAHYAEQGMEIVRQDRSVFAGFLQTYGITQYNFCLLYNPTTGQPESFPFAWTGDPSCDAKKAGNFFTSQVLVDMTQCNSGSGNIDTNVGQATITISWADGKCASGTACHKSQLVSCMSFQ